jgi:hypothetical protein
MKTVFELIEANGLTLHGDIEHFAELVRLDEREACAKVCDDWPNGRDDVYSIGVAIRARSNT